MPSEFSSCRTRTKTHKRRKKILYYCMSSLFSIGWSDFSQRSARWWTPDDRERANPEAYGSLLLYLEATVLLRFYYVCAYESG